MRTIDMAREAGFETMLRKGKILGFDRDGDYTEELKAFEALVRADERMSFYGQDKPAECADSCPPNQICDYCQVVAPVKAMILAERVACESAIEELLPDADRGDCAAAIRARGQA
jgi:hypothetical protein